MVAHGTKLINRFANQISVLQNQIDLRSGEILPSVDEPLDRGDDEPDEESNDAVICEYISVPGVYIGH